MKLIPSTGHSTQTLHSFNYIHDYAVAYHRRCRFMSKLRICWCSSWGGRLLAMTNECYGLATVSLLHCASLISKYIFLYVHSNICSTNLRVGCLAINCHQSSGLDILHEHRNRQGIYLPRYFSGGWLSGGSSPNANQSVWIFPTYSDSAHVTFPTSFHGLVV